MLEICEENKPQARSHLVFGLTNWQGAPLADVTEKMAPTELPKAVPAENVPVEPTLPKLIILVPTAPTPP